MNKIKRFFSKTPKILNKIQNNSLFKWIKWWLWETRRCEHSSLDSCFVALYDVGRNKGWWCRKCGKLLHHF